jgi:lysozyme
MKISEKALTLIAEFEGFRSKPYKCPADVPTIGYGTTVYLNGKKVTMQDPPISKEEALNLLSLTANKFAQQVDERVGQQLNQHQFDALVSFAYNVGIGAFSRSTLLKKVNANPCDKSIAYEFSRWKKAGGKVLPGLERRRKAEADLYFQICN